VIGFLIISLTYSSSEWISSIVQKRLLTLTLFNVQLEYYADTHCNRTDAFCVN